jgi:hypothetical protein
MKASHKIAAQPIVVLEALFPGYADVIAKLAAAPRGSIARMRPPVTAKPANTAGQLTYWRDSATATNSEGREFEAGIGTPVEDEFCDLPGERGRGFGSQN